jgi:IS30 family transposase
MDTIIDNHHMNAILTLVERSNNLCFIRRLRSGKKSSELAKVVIELLSDYKDFVHTITVDNGTEFSCHKAIFVALEADIYFTHPYSAWENGTIENTNKLIREYIPKNSNFADYDDKKLQEIQDKINNRARKKLNYYSPIEKFLYITKKNKVAFRN